MKLFKSKNTETPSVKPMANSGVLSKKARKDAIEQLAKEGYSEKIEPHEAKCPKCGYEWTMGEEEYEEDEESEDEE